MNQLRALLHSAPEELKVELRGLSAAGLVRKSSRFRPGKRSDGVLDATKLALRSVARRCRAFSEEIAELAGQLDWLVGQAAPELAAVGDNPAHMGSKASFARLCRVAPIPASSGKVVRHRLNRRGNRALYVIAFGRTSRDERTRAYVARRTGEGKSKKETIRCLKRYIARETYKIFVPRPLPESPGFSAP